MSRFWIAAACCLFLHAATLSAQPVETPAKYIQENYTRSTHKIKVRDDVHLHTIVYAPKDTSKKYPIIAFVYPGPQTESVTKTFSKVRAAAGLRLGILIVDPRVGEIFRAVQWFLWQRDVVV